MKISSFGFLSLLVLSQTGADPSSKPYVPFRTSPFDQPINHQVEYTANQVRSTVRKHNRNINQNGNDACPLQFTLGVSKRSHHNHNVDDNKKMKDSALSLVNAPVIYPVYPSRGPGRQVLYTTQYEHLDLLTPASAAQFMSTSSSNKMVKEGLVQQEDFPLLFESSSFHASPIIHDVNGDGIPDAILVDYDGGVYVVGVDAKPNERRFFSRAQVPRLFIRRSWMESRLNETLGIKDPDNSTVSESDPYHSYFEYSTNTNPDKILRGVTADLMGQDNADLKGLEERRKRKVHHKRSQEDSNDPEIDSEKKDSEEVHHLEEHRFETDSREEARRGRRLQEQDSQEGGENHDEHDSAFMNEHKSSGEEEHVHMTEREGWGDDDIEDGRGYIDDDLVIANHHYEDEREASEEDKTKEEHGKYPTDDAYPAMYDDMYVGAHDDYYGGGHKKGYYDEEHYIRIPPHVLCDPILVEMPKPYSREQDEFDDVLIVAVSYYLDEDEYEGHFSYKRFENTDRGDETETQRGMYVSNAVLFYKWSGGGTGSWGRQEQLDLSGDFSAPQNSSLVAAVPINSKDGSQMGAFALSTPTVADLDGDGSLDLLIATSMGLVYNFEAQNLYNRDGWPIQLKNPVESRILVEDVVGDTNLEIFVADIGGNILCLDHKGKTLWHRNLMENLGMENAVAEKLVVGSSPMSLGDVNGDGKLDLVVVICAGRPSQETFYVFALSAVTGQDVESFPIAIGSQSVVRDSVNQKFPQPLLVDLHGDQGHLKSYLHRNGTNYRKPDKRISNKASGTVSNGGSAPGLHIVQPIGSELYIIEAGSGCIQTVDIGDKITSMVQVDDVHGTNSLDLVVSTESGNIVTLESPAVPFHSLNVWNNGGGGGSQSHFGNGVVAHGMSASQGIFIHDVSRQYRDIFGVYVPITFEIFDNRPNVRNEKDKQTYKVEMRDGTSSRRSVMRREYNEPGVYTERVYIPYGPGYYTFTVLLKTSHGLVYEDRFHVGYNVDFMQGFGVMLWLPLVVAAIPILFCGRKKLNWDDEDFGRDERGGRGLGILGRGLPTIS